MPAILHIDLDNECGSQFIRAAGNTPNATALTCCDVVHNFRQTWLVAALSLD
jgi:hypothetical protein